MVVFQHRTRPRNDWDRGTVISATTERVTIRWDDGDESWFWPAAMDLVEVQ